MPWIHHLDRLLEAPKGGEERCCVLFLEVQLPLRRRFRRRLGGGREVGRLVGPLSKCRGPWRSGSRSRARRLRPSERPKRLRKLRRAAESSPPRPFESRLGRETRQILIVGYSYGSLIGAAAASEIPEAFGASVWGLRALVSCRLRDVGPAVGLRPGPLEPCEAHCKGPIGCRKAGRSTCSTPRT